MSIAMTRNVAIDVIKDVLNNIDIEACNSFLAVGYCEIFSPDFQDLIYISINHQKSGIACIASAAYKKTLLHTTFSINIVSHGEVPIAWIRDCTSYIHVAMVNSECSKQEDLYDDTIPWILFSESSDVFFLSSRSVSYNSRLCNACMMYANDIDKLLRDAE